MARTRIRAVPERPAFYARISQDRTGLSAGVNDQIAQGRERLAAAGWPEPVIYEDNDISARSGKIRPGFEQMLVDIESGAVDGLAARHLDRLLRRVTDLERVLDVIESQRRPIPVLLVESSEIDLSSASGRLLARILASVAANESEMKSERVVAARWREAHAGKAHGHLGYGYDADQVIVPKEAEIVQEVARRIIDGQSLRSIATDLNARRIPTPGAGRWDARRVRKVVERGERRDLIDLIKTARSPETSSAVDVARAINRAGAPDKWTAGRVRKHGWSEHLEAEGHGLDDSMIAVLLHDAEVPADDTHWRAANLGAMIQRGSLCGWREFSPGGRGGGGDLVAEGDWSPILPKETTETIRAIMDRPGVRGPEPKYLLTGVLLCGKCESPMGGSPDGRGGWRYQCSKQPGLQGRCGGLTVAGHPVDEVVTQLVVDTLADADVRAGVKRKTQATGEVAWAEEELAKVKELRDEYAEEAGDGVITREQLRSISKRLMERQRAAEKILGAWAPPAALVLRNVPTRRPDIQAWWGEVDLAERRRTVQALIESITVAPSTGGRGGRFDESRLAEPVWRL